MKYMGSKRAMLASGLGELLLDETRNASRFADLFTGSGVVAWFIAENASVPVLASDVQSYAATLAGAVVERTECLDSESVWQNWWRQASDYLSSSDCLLDAQRFEQLDWLSDSVAAVEYARSLSRSADGCPLTQVYGGYYFSPLQALMLDALRATLPESAEDRASALAAVIETSAQCAASPGHTAQPFQPTPRAARYLFEAWRRDVFIRAHQTLVLIAGKAARVRGLAAVEEATISALQLGSGDVAFVDPPYSNVHYSRFYHVLETVARGGMSEASGQGRYPPRGERPRSSFSLRSESEHAMRNLLGRLAERRVRTILTFPEGEASNGLSGVSVEGIASEYFTISKTVVNGRFSTLGGNAVARRARMPAYEMILVLTPS